jgi:hypothetical protein
MYDGRSLPTYVRAPADYRATGTRVVPHRTQAHRTRGVVTGLTKDAVTGLTPPQSLGVLG